MQQKEDRPHHPFSFQKKERICSDIVLERLLSKRQSLFCYPFKCFYDFEPCTGGDCFNMVALSVPKKRIRHAVDRNLVKRRTREAYRLNKHILDTLPEKEGRRALLFFVFVGTEVPSFNFISDKIISLLKRLLSC